MRFRQWYVYILASKKYGTLYMGVTNDLLRRVYEHKHDLIDGFTKKYEVHNLVYFEVHDSSLAAMSREKLLKRWKRDWKFNLIERDNPDWVDTYPNLVKDN